MSKVYYVFSENHLCETLCICNDNDSIENPIGQAGIYDMGVFISKSAALLRPFIESNYSTLRKEDILLNEIQSQKILKLDTSFSNAIQGDDAAYKILELLLLGHPSIFTKREYNTFLPLLKCYVNYISLCTEKTELCSVEKLNLLVQGNEDTIPSQITYLRTQSKTSVGLSKSEMKSLLSDTSLKKQFYDPQLKNEQNPMQAYMQSSGSFSLETDFTRIKETNYKNVELPLEVFEINDIVDLILVSLQCIFVQKRFIRKCAHCGSLFVTRNSNMKYCPRPRICGESRTCYQEEKLERQLRNETSESAKLVKSLRIMLYNRYQHTSDSDLSVKRELEYKEFLADSKRWKTEVECGQKTETEFVEWLKSKYARKYKSR